MAPVINQNVCHPSYLVLTCSTNRQSPETQTRSRGPLRCRRRRQHWTKTRLPCVTQCADPEIISQSRTTTPFLILSPPTPNSAPAFCFRAAVSDWGLLSCTLLMGLKLNVALFPPRWTQGTSFLAWRGVEGEGRKGAGCLALVPSRWGPIHPSH